MTTPQNYIKVPSFEDDEEKQLRYNQYLPSQNQLDKHRKEWREVYEDLSKRSPSVFGHFDVQASNIIYDTKMKSLALVDWECCNVAPEILDVAMLACRDLEFLGVFTDSDSMKKWLKVYLSTHPVYGKQPLTADILNK